MSLGLDGLGLMHMPVCAEDTGDHAVRYHGSAEHSEEAAGQAARAAAAGLPRPGHAPCAAGGQGNSPAAAGGYQDAATQPQPCAAADRAAADTAATSRRPTGSSCQ